MQHRLQSEWKAAASPAAVAAGHVNLIDLAGIKAASGERWERARGGIYARLEGLIGQSLGPTDSFARIDDTTFLIAMPESSPEHTLMSCLRIAQDLQERMLGAVGGHQVQVARAVSVQNDVLNSEIVTEAMLPVAARNAGGKNRQGQPARSATALNRFAPIWDAVHQVVTAFSCTPDRSQFAPEETETGEMLLARLQHATAILAERLQREQKFLLCLSLPYDQLGSPVVRMEMSALFRSLPAALRPYLQLEISDLPEGVPESRLGELIAVLRPFCRSVAIHLPGNVLSYGTYHIAGLQGIGISLSPDRAGIPDPLAEIAKLSNAAKRLRIRSFVTDLQNPELLDFAVENGICAVSGQLIGEPKPNPDQARRLSLDEIRARPAGQGDSPDGDRNRRLTA